MQLIVTDELPELNAHLTQLYVRLNGDLTPVMQGIGALLKGSTRQRFTDKQDPEGDPWQALAPSTIAAKKGRGGILVDYGNLMKSITYHASSQSVAVGTDRLYGKYHQTGTVDFTARPFLGLSDDDQADILDLINDFISEAVNG